MYILPHLVDAESRAGIIAEHRANPLYRPTRPGETNPKIRADMTYFKTPRDGAVFSVGSMAWCGSLSHNGYDNNVSRITRNVIDGFLRDGPLP